MAFRILYLVPLAFLMACGDREPILMHAAENSQQDGPDEFSVEINKPLAEPETYATLLPPSNVGGNRADIIAKNEAIVALGGRVPATGQVASASPLLSYVSRFGFDPRIRQTLAAEDQAWREKNEGKPLERLFDLNVYFEAYEKMSLDQYEELARLRGFGIQTPAAPPNPAR